MTTKPPSWISVIRKNSGWILLISTAIAAILTYLTWLFE